MLWNMLSWLWPQQHLRWKCHCGSHKDNIDFENGWLFIRQRCLTVCLQMHWSAWVLFPILLSLLGLGVFRAAITISPMSTTIQRTSHPNTQGTNSLWWPSLLNIPPHCFPFSMFSPCPLLWFWLHCQHICWQIFFSVANYLISICQRRQHICWHCFSMQCLRKTTKKLPSINYMSILTSYCLLIVALAKSCSHCHAAIRHAFAALFNWLLIPKNEQTWLNTCPNKATCYTCVVEMIRL